MNLAEAQIAVLAENQYQELELWYPLLGCTFCHPADFVPRFLASMRSQAYRVLSHLRPSEVRLRPVNVCLPLR